MAPQLLPTPAASNPNDGEDVGSWLARRDRQRARGINGNGMGVPLAVAAALLPTPMASDGQADPGHAVTAQGSPDLRTVVPGLFPTPQSRDGDPRRGAPSPEVGGAWLASGRRNLDDAAALLPTPDAGHGRKQTRTGPLLAGVVELLPSAAEPERWGRYAAAVARWEGVTGNPAPDPTVPGTKGQPVLNPRLSEWLMGLPPGWLDVPGVSANAQKAAAGNGVVPQQATAALRILLGLDGSVAGLSGPDTRETG